MAVTFGRDRLSLTLVACLALLAVIWGRDVLYTLSFAGALIVILPLLRYFKLLD